jgi:regulator of sirC expression with transglutaminase-like and TPR domain
MFADAARERFTSMVSLDDEDIDLLAASLLIAQEEDPTVSVSAEFRRVVSIAQGIENELGSTADFYHIIHALRVRLYEELGFRGDASSPSDPAAFLLPGILDRRIGSPIGLSILYLEIARRLGIEAHGVSLPGHFVVRVDDSWGRVFVDPWAGGRVVLTEELQERVRRIAGRDVELTPEMLKPASSRRILSRLLRNLKRAHLRRADLEGALLSCERLVILHPERVVEKRDRGLLYARTGHRSAAIADLRDYLDVAFDAEDAPRIRRALIELLASRAAEA